MAYTQDELLEHAIINQIEADLESKEFDSLSCLLSELMKDADNKQRMINYLGDSAKENLIEGKTKIRY